MEMVKLQNPARRNKHKEETVEKVETVKHAR